MHFKDDDEGNEIDEIQKKVPRMDDDAIEFEAGEHSQLSLVTSNIEGVYLHVYICILKTQIELISLFQFN